MGHDSWEDVERRPDFGSSENLWHQRSCDGAVHWICSATVTDALAPLADDLSG